MRNEILDCMYVRLGWLLDCMGGEKSRIVVSIPTMKMNRWGMGEFSRRARMRLGWRWRRET
jgi:hypothetical protein